VLDAVLAAELLEPLGGEAAAAIGEHMRGPEGEGDNGLLEEDSGTGLGLVILDRQVDEAGAAVDGDEQVALAELAIGRPRLGQVLHVEVDEAEFVLLELAGSPLGLGQGRPTVRPAAWKMR
jgi:hypothetical protein